MEKNTVTVAKPKRVFKCGSAVYADPCPHGSFEDAIRMLSLNHPVFRMQRIYEEEGVPNANNELVYALPVPPVKVNG